MPQTAAPMPVFREKSDSEFNSSGSDSDSESDEKVKISPSKEVSRPGRKTIFIDDEDSDETSGWGN
jgi:hypothetical protein